MLNKRYQVCLLLGVFSILPFLSGLNYDFVYDDHGVITENEFLANPANIVPVLTLQTLTDSSIVDSGRPAVIASYFFDQALWGMNPAGYRATSLLLHALTAMLVFLFLARLFRDRWAAVACAILFAWHPLVVEPVQSPAFREDVLCLFGGMIFLLCAAGRSTSGLRHAVSVTGYAIALLSKETAIIFPLIIGAKYWLFPETRLEKRTCPFWRISVVLLSVLWIWLTFAGKPVQAVGADWNGLAFRGTEGFWSAPWLALWYAKKMLIPFSLSVDYVISPIAGPADGRFFLGVLVLIAGAVLVWRMRFKQPAISLALSWIFLFFIPVSNVLPLLNPVADRYAYMMLPGFALLVVTLVNKLNWKPKIILAFIGVVFFSGSFVRVKDWKTDQVLWAAALEVEPRSARANTWLGLIERRNGDRMAAWELFSRAEQLNPEDPSPSINKATLVGEMGDFADAEMRLREVLKKHPGHVFAKKNLALTLRLQGRDAEADSIGSSTNR